MRNLRHLAYLVDNCPERYLNFGLENGKFITLDRDRAQEATPEILETNAISHDRCVAGGWEGLAPGACMCS